MNTSTPQAPERILTFFDLLRRRAYFSLDSSPPLPSGRTSGGISPSSSRSSSSPPPFARLAAACCLRKSSRSLNSSEAD